MEKYNINNALNMHSNEALYCSLCVIMCFENAVLKENRKSNYFDGFEYIYIVKTKTKNNEIIESK